jgi:hypothetical protein
MKLIRILIGGFLIVPFLGCSTYNTHKANEEQIVLENKGCRETYKPGYPVELQDCELISKVISASGIKGGFAAYGSTGDIVLRGSYDNEEQVERAFTIAQTVVGDGMLRNISELTPRDVRDIRYAAPRSSKTKPGTGTTYAVSIGVRYFLAKIPEIEAAEDDADAFAQTLRDLGVPGANISVLKSREATKKNILAALNSLSQKAGKSDKVVLFLSSHGAPPSMSSGLGIVPHDYGVNLPLAQNKRGVRDVAKIAELADVRIRLKRTAITGDELFSALHAIDSERLVVVLDTCFSGAVMKNFAGPAVSNQVYDEASSNIILSPRLSDLVKLLGGSAAAKDIVASQGDSAPSAAASARLDSRQETLLRKINSPQNSGKSSLAREFEFSDLPSPPVVRQKEAARGRVIITSSSNNEKSWFSSDVSSQSIFTSYYLKGLRKYNGNVNDAFEYAKPRTSFAAQVVSAQHSGGKAANQTPQILGQNYPERPPILNLGMK